MESPSKFRLRRMNQNAYKGCSMKTIIRPLTNYSTTRPINLQKPQTTIKNGPTRRVNYSISDNKAQCKLLIIHFEGLIGCLVRSDINHKERIFKMRPDYAIGLQSLTRYFLCVLISRHSGETLNNIVTHLESLSIHFDAVYTHKRNLPYTNYNQIYKDFQIASPLTDVIILASYYPLESNNTIHQIISEKAPYSYSTNELPYSKTDAKYPLVVLVEDPQAIDGENALSMFYIWKHLMTIAIKSTISYESGKSHLIHYFSQSDESVKQLMETVNWERSFNLVCEQGEYNVIKTDAIDKRFIKADSLKFTLRMGIAKDYKPLYNTSNKKFMTDPILKDYATKANDDIRQHISDYAERYRQRRKQEKNTPYSKTDSTEHRLILMSSTDCKLQPTERIVIEG